MEVKLFLKTVGKNIAALRKAKGLRQPKAAELAGISYRYYQRIEAGEANITLYTLFNIAWLLRVHPKDLI